MAVGGEIKTVLSLDVSKFTSNIDRATNDLSKFDKGLKEAAKVAATFEKSTKEMANESAAVSEKFKLLDQTISSFINKLAATAEKLSGITKATGTVKKAAGDLNDGLKPVKGTLASISKETDVFRIAMDSLKPSLQRAGQGSKDLARAQKEAAEVAKQASADTIKAKLAELENERRANTEIVMQRRRTAAELAQIETEFRNQALGQRIQGSRYFGKNADRGRPMLEAADRASASADNIRREIDARLADAAAIERENAEIEKRIGILNQEAIAEREAASVRQKAAQDAILAEKNQKDAALAAAAARKEADRQATNSAREMLAARKQAAREAAMYERDQANQIAAMWKGMGSLWAASKIEHALKGSVGLADQMQREKVKVQSLGYTPEHNQSIYDSAFNMSSQLKFISTLDAIKSRMSAIASIGYDNADVIDKTLNNAVKAANNLQQLGLAHGDTQNTIRNLYGVVEMRQQTADAGATNSTFDVLQKIILGTQGKVQTQDVETMMRRLGIGASQLSDNGLMNLAAIIDQFKVAGGEHGGGSAGVATVGTMIKMFQSYALGKGLSNEAVREFSGAGVLATDGLNLKNDAAGVLRDAKHAGLKDAQLWLNDPVAAIQKIMPQIIAFTQRKENRARYYENRDINNEEAQAVAVSKYLASLGITTTASQGFFVAGDPRSAERIKHQVATMKGEKSIDGVDADMQKTYARNVQELKAAFENLGATVGTTLLPSLTAVVKAINSIVQSGAEFARNNPMATQFTAMGLAAGGVVLALKGVVSMFGMFGGLKTTLTAVTAAFLGEKVAATEAALATEAAGKSGGVAKGSMLTLSGALGGMKRDWEAYGKTIRTNVAAGELAMSTGALTIRGHMGLLGSMATSTAKLVGKAFLRMIPLVGELLMAWDFANLIAGLEVGGHKISEWMARTMDWVVTVAKNGWERVKDVFTLGMNHAAHAAAIAANNKEYDDNGKANGFGEQSKASSLPPPPPSPPATPSAAPHVDDSAARAAIANAAGGKRPRQFENLYLQSLAQLQGNETIARLKLGSILSGNDSYQAQAAAAFQKHWLGGQFDDGHDPTKRKFMKAGATNRDDINSLDMNNPQVKKWIAEKAALLELDEQIKAVTFARERAKATDEGAKSAVDALTEGTVKQSAAMKALVAEFARANQRNAPSQQALADQAASIANQQIIDSASYAQKLKEKNGSFKFDTNADGSAMDSRTRILTEHADLIKKVTDEYAAQAANASSNENKIAAAYGKDSERYKEAVEARKAIDDEYAKYKANLDHQLAEQLRTPLDKLIDTWKNYNDQIEQGEADWANRILGTIEGVTNGGIKSFKSFKDQVRSMFVDLLRGVEDMLLKQALGNGIKSLVSNVGSGIQGLMAGLSSAGSSNGSGAGGMSGIVAGLKSFWNSLTGADKATKSLADNGVKAMTDATGKQVAQTVMQTTSSVSTTTSLTALGSAAQYAAIALGQISSAGGASQAAVGGIGSLFSSFGTASTYGTAVGSEQTAMLAAQDAGLTDVASSGGFWSSIMGAFGFANGGIMTSLGPVALKAYANGGIANGPQLALFGEGRTNEAYVPLPDGRTIPVTLTGDKGGGNNVTINIVVNKGGDTTTTDSQKQGDDTTQWKNLAGKIKGLVQQELIAEQRPGGLLYK